MLFTVNRFCDIFVQEEVGVTANSLGVGATNPTTNETVTSVIETVIGTDVNGVRDEPHHARGQGHQEGHGHHRPGREVLRGLVDQPGPCQDTWYKYQKYHLIRKY